jgi:hypothetical protein
MQRPLLVLVLLLVVVPAAAAQPDAKPRPPGIVLAQASGEIKALNLKRITVGQLSCLLGSKAVRASRFVITDPVAITCQRGKLLEISYAPVVSSSTTATSSQSTSTTSRSGSGPTGSTHSSSAIAVLTPGSSQRVSQSAKGPIIALSAQGITVGELTCPVGGGGLEFLSARFRIGDVVTLSCTSGGSGGQMMNLTAASSSSGG